MDFARTAVPNLQALLRAQDRARFADPSDDATLPRICIAYTRADASRDWEHVGIIRLTRKLTCALFGKIRRELKIHPDAELRLVAVSNRDPEAKPHRQRKLSL